MIITARPARVPIAITIAAALGGSLVSAYYHRLGLTLSHYDARGHLVVARRVFDSLTPGWQQVGAVWLPLPHLLNLLPVQFDLLYRTGLSATAISVASFAIATGAIAWIVAAITEAWFAALAGALVFALNPNVLYLQATPMTEPLLLGLQLTAIALLMSWCRTGGPRTEIVGGVFALACLSRYEAWPVTLWCLLAAVWVRRRSGEAWRSSLFEIARLGVYPATAIAGFLTLSRVVVGHWFVSTGFFVPENAAQGYPGRALAEIVWGVRAVSGPALLGTALLGAAAVMWLAWRRRDRGWAILPLSLVCMAAPAWMAFVDGHPYRIRYMVPLIAAQAVLAGTLAGVSRRFAIVGSVALLGLTVFEIRPLDPAAPMVVEAQWDRPNAAERQKVTDYLVAHYQGETIMASMGSLGHYMQDLSRSGFPLRSFLHEGNGDVWLSALYGPRAYVGWLLVEEKAEGGDVLAEAIRANPWFLEGFSRVSEGAGVALYRRDPDGAHRAVDEFE